MADNFLDALSRKGFPQNLMAENMNKTPMPSMGIPPPPIANPYDPSGASRDDLMASFPGVYRDLEAQSKQRRKQSRSVQELQVQPPNPSTIPQFHLDAMKYNKDAMSPVAPAFEITGVPNRYDPVTGKVIGIPSQGTMGTIGAGEGQQFSPMPAPQIPSLMNQPSQPQPMGEFPSLAGMTPRQPDLIDPTQLPLGGTASTTGQGRPMTPDETQRQQDIKASLAVGDTAESRFQQNRQQEFAGKLAERKAGVGARAIISSLEKQGMSQDEIKNALGDTSNMGKAEALRRLNVLQTSRANERAGSGDVAKTRQRIASNAKFKTEVDEQGNEREIATNPAGRSKEMLDRADSFGTDAEDDKNLRSYMSESERKQFDRTTGSMARNIKNPNAERMAARALDKAEDKRERAFAKKQAKAERDALTLASKRAQTAEDNAALNSIKSALTGINDLLGEKNSKKKPTKEQIKTLTAQRNALIEQLNAFATGTQVGAEAVATDQQIRAVIPDATDAELAEIRQGLANGFTLEQMAGG